MNADEVRKMFAAQDLSAEQTKLSKQNQHRIEGEKTVVRRVIKDLLAAGYALSVFDGEEQTVTKSEDPKEIFDAMMTTDDDRLFAHKEGEKSSFVYFVYGNDAWEVINDYGTSLEPHLKGAQEVCERLEKRGR